MQHLFLKSVRSALEKFGLQFVRHLRQSVQGPNLGSDHLAAALDLCADGCLVGVHQVLIPKKGLVVFPNPEFFPSKELSCLRHVVAAPPQDPIWPMNFIKSSL